MTLRTLNYGIYGIFLIMGTPGCVSSTVVEVGTQRTQYPLIKEYTLNYRGLNTII